MNIRLSSIILMGIMAFACTTLNIQSGPAPSTHVDPKLEPLAKEYRDLAEIAKIKFTHTIGADFKRMEEPNVIGVCYSSPGYRQIEIDTLFWSQADSYQRMALMYHELTHCYCGRNHDYKGRDYPDNATIYISEASLAEDKKKPIPLYYDDGCPRSIMHPYIVPTHCMKVHYSEYITEMFERCVPY